MAAAVLLSASPGALAQAPLPSVSLQGLPATPLIGEQFCVDASFSNATTATGYGPYLTAIVAPGIERISVNFVDIPPRLEKIGDFDATGILTDPITGDPLTGIPGGSAWIARYPVGSVDQTSPALVMTVCAVVEVGADVGVPLDVEIIPGFEFGDTTVGTNGPITGTPAASTVTPLLARVSKANSAPEGERTPGPSHPFTYTWTVDISSGVSIENVVLNDALPAEIQWTGAPIVVTAPLGPSCAVTQNPNSAPTPGGAATVSCSTVLGAGGGDITVSIPVYVTDILDETMADSRAITNTVTFDFDYQGNPQPRTSADSTLVAKHAAIQKSVTGTGLPGGLLTYAIAFQLTDYPDVPADAGASAFEIDDVVADGLRYQRTVALVVDSTSYPITPIETPGPGPGETTLLWDIAAALPGGVLPNGARGTLTFEAEILDTYANGDRVLAADGFSNSAEARYELTSGAMDADISTIDAAIQRSLTDKSIFSPNPLPAALRPGDEVVFELEKDIRAGSTSDVVLTDFLPRPVFDVRDFNPATDFRVVAVGFNPPAVPTVTTDTAANSISFDFGDLNTSRFERLRVFLTVRVVGAPFADNLFLTNLLSTSYSNTAGDVITGLDAVSLTVGAPSLEITKGVLATDNPAATIIPAPPADPSQDTADSDVSGVDAFDELTYVVTVENVGSSPAYNVTIDDPAIPELSCAEPSPGDIRNGSGQSLSFSGTLAGGLVLDAPLAGNDGTVGAPYADDTALLTLRCTLAATVEPLAEIDNEAGVTWTSVPDPAQPFTRIADTAQAVIARPRITKVLTAVTPGYAGLPRAHIGELVTYQVSVSVPEGRSSAARFEDRLDSGLAFVDVVSVTASAGVTTSEGSFAGDVLANAGLSALGGGPIAPDRRLVFGPATNDDGFGVITNSDRNNATEERITVTYRARVLNAAINVSGRTRRNRAIWSWESPGDSRRSIEVRAEPVRLREPFLRVDKTVTPDTGDNNTPPVVTLTLSHANGSAADAFDLALTDLLPPDVFVDTMLGGIDTSACAVLPTQTRITNEGTSDRVDAFWSDFPQGSTCTLSFPTRFGVTLPAGIQLTNCAELTWESLRDTDPALPMPPNNTLGVERDGSGTPPGELNNYRFEACDSYRIFGVGIEKRVTATDQAHTDNIPDTPADTESLTIGETITFELVVTIPEANVPGLEVTDLLPITDNVLELVSARTTFVGGQLTPTRNDPAVLSDRDSDGILDQAVLDYGFVGHVLDGITNDEDRIRIEVVAKVRDVLVNRNNDLSSNGALVRFLPGLTDSDSAALEFVEPLLSISKTADRSEAEAGDLVRYTLRVEHEAASRIDAKELALSDLIPSALNVVASSVRTGTVCTDAPDTGPALGAGEITAAWSTFPLGAVCEIEFQASVDVSAVIGQTITNAVDIAWTSLEGIGDPDDRAYTLDDSWPLTISEPGLSKAITATDVPTTGAISANGSEELTIGETATFTLAAEFPDGTTEQVLVVDQLPTNGVVLEITRAELVSIGGDLSLSSGLLPGDSGFDCSANPSLPQDCVAWAVGDVVNQPDARPEPDLADQLIFEVDAIVLDDPENSGLVGGDKNLQNTATLSSLNINLRATALFDLVEPLLEISKLTENNSLPAVIAPNTTQEFTLEVTHRPRSSATALDLVIEDTLVPQILWENDASATSDCPGFSLVSSPGAGNSGTVRFGLDALTPADGACTIRYLVRGDPLLNVPARFDNVAELSWQSAPGSSESRTGTSTDANALESFNNSAVSKVVVGTSVPDTGSGLGDPLLNELTIGEQVNYRIVTIFSEGTTANVQLTDTLEAGGTELELVSGNVLFIGDNLSTSQPGTPAVDPNNPSIVTVDYGTVENLGDANLDADDSIIYELVARVVDVPDNQDGVVLTNAVQLDFPGGPANESVDIEVVEPDLTIDKTFLDLTEGVATIKIEVENQGTAPAYDLEITDAFDETLWLAGSLQPLSVPARFTLTEASASGTSTVTLATLGNPSRPEEVLDPGETLSVSFTYELLDDGLVSVSQIDNEAEAIYTSLPGPLPGERTYTASDLDRLEFADLSLEKAWSGPNDPALPGDTLTYTLTLENLGAGPATDVVVADDLAQMIGEFQAGSVVASGGGTVESGNGASDTELRVRYASLAASASVTITFDMLVPLPYPDSAVPERLENQATVDSKEQGIVLSDDPATADPDDATIVPILADPIMTVSKDDQVLLTSPGQVLDYLITYGNVGNQDATGVVLTETVPANTRFTAAASTPGWSCADGSAPGTRCELTIGSLSLTPGTAVFAVQVDSALGPAVTEIVNEVAISDDGLENDPTAPIIPSTDQAQEITPIGGAFPQLTIDKDDGGIGVTPGQRYGYRISYANIGNQAATGVVITETVPDDVVFSATASAPARWSCPDGSPPGTVCSIVVPLLPAQTTEQLSFGLDVLFPAAAGRDLIVNSVAITDDGGNSATPSTDSDADDTPLIASPDIFVNKTPDVAETNVNESIVYSAEYGNQGNQDSTGVIVREVVPVGSTFNAADSAPTNWSCADGAVEGSVCEFLAGDVAVGAVGMLTFAIDVVGIPDDREIRNVIDANDDGANGADPVPDNNTDIVITPFIVLSIDTLSRGGLLLLALAVLFVGARQRRRI
jgi:uncharacterized repeat protein (TIGR01451 family)/fimbrial isopeptide formation D2 family protein